MTEEEICPITLEPIINRCFLPCGHLFDQSSIDRLEIKKCPLCRHPFDEFNEDDLIKGSCSVNDGPQQELPVRPEHRERVIREAEERQREIQRENRRREYEETMRRQERLERQERQRTYLRPLRGPEDERKEQEERARGILYNAMRL